MSFDYVKRWKGWRMSCDVGEVTESLENEQTFRHVTYVTAHSPTLPSLYLRLSSFSNSSVGSPTSQLILQPYLRFSYVTGSSLTSPGEPPMVHYRPYIIPPLASMISKSYTISRNTQHLPQIYFNIILSSTSRPPWLNVPFLQVSH